MQWRGALLLLYAGSLNGEARVDGGRGVHPAGMGLHVQWHE